MDYKTSCSSNGCECLGGDPCPCDDPPDDNEVVDPTGVFVTNSGSYCCNLDSGSSDDIRTRGERRRRSGDVPTTMVNRRVFVEASAAAAVAIQEWDQEEAKAADGMPPNVVNDNNSTHQGDDNASAQQRHQQQYPTAQPPFSSVRRYKLVTLSNGLQVLLVSDKRSIPLASAALTIGGAGQFSDPDDLPGLAHLMEHMILSESKNDAKQRSTTTSTTTTTAIPKTSKSIQSSERQQPRPPITIARPLPPLPPQDFEDWLNTRDGCSNGYTAYDNVCFHFVVDALYFQETLQLFASLFVADHVERVCCNDNVLRREISRIDNELAMDQVTTQAYFLTKNFVNSEHPYHRFGLGNKRTLQDIPNDKNINVSNRLIQFFHRYYQSNQAVLVVLGPQDLSTLARWATPFASTLSSSSYFASSPQVPTNPRYYPGGFLQGGKRLKQLLLARNEPPMESTTATGTATGGEILTMEWILNLDYTSNALPLGSTTAKEKPVVITGSQVAFVLSQVLGRRCSGSLYRFLLERRWVKIGSIPIWTVPVDVSGFQLLKLEISLTLEGFLHRSAVIVAVMESLDAFGTQQRRRRRDNRLHLWSSSDGDDDYNYSVSRVLLTSWATIAKLFGYTLASRPPDVIELAQDAQIYGINAVVASMGGGRTTTTPTSTTTGNHIWYRFPSPEDRLAMKALGQSVMKTLTMMRDPDTAVVTITAGPKSISQAKLPPPSHVGAIYYSSSSSFSQGWITEPTTGGQFLYDDMSARVGGAGVVSPSSLPWTRRGVVLDYHHYHQHYREVLWHPVLNTLIPLVLRPPRLSLLPPAARAATMVDSARGDWFIAFPNHEEHPLLPMPIGPPEPTCRCAFVIQLLSSRPAIGGVRQAAHGELFKLSFELALSDLGELGAPGALAYDVSYNKYGMRIAILGLSQNIGSYTRRVCRRLIAHSNTLYRGPEIFQRVVTNAAVREVNSARGMSSFRKRTLVSSVRRSTAYEAAAEGLAFFQSVEGAVCFAQGDLMPDEVQDIAKDVRDIFDLVIGDESRSSRSSSWTTTRPALPDLQSLVYLPVWKPRFGSPCGIAGVPLIADACGRIPR